MTARRKKNPPQKDSNRPNRGPETSIKALLENRARRALLDVLGKKPGLNKNQLAEKLGISVSGVDFHLTRLIDNKLVETKPAWKGREVLCFTAENVKLWKERSTRVLYGRAFPRRVAIFIAENPGVTLNHIAEVLDEPTHRIRRKLDALKENDLVQHTRICLQVLYYPQPTLLEWVKNVGKKFWRG